MSSAILKPISAPTKVCIVRIYSTSASYDYAVFIVDLKSRSSHDDDVFIPTAPTLLIDPASFDDKSSYAFCVLDSTLYMFQENGTSVYTYDLSPFLNTNDANDKSNLRLYKTMMGNAVPDMLAPKANLNLARTPDGKRVLVFSTRFFFDCTHPVNPDEVNFELYDPDEINEPRRKLLSLYDCFIGRRPQHFKIKAFTFLSNSLFFIQTDIGMFTLDIDEPKLGWQQLKSFAGTGYVPLYDHFFVIGDELCFDVGGAYDISRESVGSLDPENSSTFPKTSFGDCVNHQIWRVYGAIHPLDDTFNYADGGGRVVGGEFWLVQLGTGINEDTEFAHMLVNVCSFDIDKYREDKLVSGDLFGRIETSIVKSFKFILNGDTCNLFFPVCLLPIRAGVD